MKPGKLLKYAGIGVVVLLVLVFVLKKMGIAGKPDATKVSTEKVAKRSVIETVSASGKINPEREVKISADVSGEIVELAVREGQQVEKGALLVKINPDIYVSNVDRTVATLNTTRANLANSRSRLVQAESQLKRTEQTFQRNQKLFKEGVISVSEMENFESSYEVAKAEVEAMKQGVLAAEYNVRSAEATLKEARDNLGKTSIFSPVAGTVSKLNVEPGERVVGTLQMAGTEIMRIANLNEMEVSVDVSESDIVRVKMSDTASIEVDAYPDKKFNGVVTQIANSANTNVMSTDQVTNFTVKIRIDRSTYKDILPSADTTVSPFRPGMSATVEIQTNRADNILTVPVQSVTVRDTTEKQKTGEGETIANQEEEASTEKKARPEEIVLIVQDGRAIMRKVKTGIQDNRYIQVTEGVEEGEEVVSGPYSAISRTLKNESVVEVVAADKLFTAEKSSP